MYAPVATRFRTYGVKLGSTAAAYMEAILADPDMLAWEKAAMAEGPPEPPTPWEQIPMYRRSSPDASAPAPPSPPAAGRAAVGGRGKVRVERRRGRAEPRGRRRVRLSGRWVRRSAAQRLADRSQRGDHQFRTVWSKGRRPAIRICGSQGATCRFTSSWTSGRGVRTRIWSTSTAWGRCSAAAPRPRWTRRRRSAATSVKLGLGASGGRCGNTHLRHHRSPRATP